MCLVHPEQGPAKVVSFLVMHIILRWSVSIERGRTMASKDHYPTNSIAKRDDDYMILPNLGYGLYQVSSPFQTYRMVNNIIPDDKFPVSI